MDEVTKEDLRDALAPYATREDVRFEIRTALEAYATREEMRHEIRAEIRAALEPYATRGEMLRAIADEGVQTRRHFDVVAESLRGDIRLLAEAVVTLQQSGPTKGTRS